MIYTLRFFSLQNAVRFIILTYLVPVLLTFYIQSVLKLKKKSDTKRLKEYLGFCIKENGSVAVVVVLYMEIC